MLYVLMLIGTITRYYQCPFPPIGSIGKSIRPIIVMVTSVLDNL